MKNKQIRSPRLILLGLDGADPDFFSQNLTSMPFLANLVKKGGMGGLESTIPPFTLTAWSTAMSGMNPGKTGVNCFPEKDFVPHRIEVDSNSVKTARIWEIASVNELKVAVLNVPLTFPVSPLNGCMISSFLTPRDSENFTWPPDLRKDLPDDYRTSLDFEQHRSKEEIFLGHLEYLTEKQFRAARQILSQQSWDIFIFVFSGTDWIQHYYGLMKLTPGEVQKKLINYFAKVDQRLSSLFNDSKDENFIIISDHGFGKVPCHIITLNSWLKNKGYLTLNPSTPRAGKQFLTPARIRALGKLPGASLIRKHLPLAFKEKTLRASRPKARDIDWAQTQAHFALFMNHTGYIRLHKSGPDRIKLQDQLIPQLKQLGQDAPQGPVFTQVVPRESIFNGPCLEEFPDILLEFSPEWTGSEALSGETFSDIPSGFLPAATHRHRGLLIASGPSFGAGWNTEARLEDIVPTICAILDIPLPEGSDGKILSQILAKDFNYTLKTRLYSRPAGTGHQWNEQERNQVTERLTALGYLD